MTLLVMILVLLCVVLLVWDIYRQGKQTKGDDKDVS